MGTATQAISNQTQQDQFDRLLKEALVPIDPNETELEQIKREVQLGRKFREIVNEVIATDRSLSGIKPTLDAAITKAVKPVIEDKLRKWIQDGKKKAEWPFKDVNPDPR